MRAIRLFLASLVVIVGTVAISGQGPSSAQITQALRVFLTEAHTWTATQTFKNVVINGTCTGSGCGGGGGGTPGGSTTQVQYNNAGSFGGITGATTNGTALTLVAPILGTPASVTLTNATGLPIGTGVSGLGTGVSTLLGTFSIANLTTALGATGTPSSTTFLRGDNQWATPEGGGSVTSVALTMPSGFTVSGSPVTSTGTLAVSLAAGGVSTLLDTIGNTRGSVLYRGSTGWAILTPGTSGDVLEAQGTGADPIWNTPSGIGLGNFSSTAVASTDGEIVVFNGTSGLSGRNSFAVLSGPATTAKTFTLPNASAAILTDNATVTAAQGGTSFASYTKGDLLCASGSTTLTKLGVGSDTNVLTADSAQTCGVKWASGGGGSGTVTSVAVAVPTILTVSGSPVTTAGTITLALSTGAGAIMGKLLEEHTASTSATLDFTTAFTSAYDVYQVELITILPATANVTLQMLVSSDGGSTWIVASNYRTQAYGQDSSTNVGGTASTSATAFTLGDTNGLSNTSTSGIIGTVKLYNLLTSSSFFSFHGDIYGELYNDGRSRRQFIGGSYASAVAVNAVRFQMSSGNIASGTIRVYGISK